MGRPVTQNVQLETAQPQNATQQLEQVEQYVGQYSDSSRIVMLHGDVNEHSIANVITQLLYYAGVDPNKAINLVISTYGGSIDEMFSLYDTIKFLPCEVHTVGLGKVMSAGVLLLASGQKGRRLVGKTSRIMIHPISGGTYGDVFEMQNQAKESLRMQKLLVETLSAESKLSKKKIEKIMSLGYDHYITPDLAIEYGIVDDVIGAKSRGDKK